MTVLRNDGRHRVVSSLTRHGCRLPRLALAGLLLLSGCGEPGGPPLVSAQSPAGTGLVNSNAEPQPINSLPPGAEGLSTGGPFTTQPDYLSYTFGR
jgi:hypothetical protein